MASTRRAARTAANATFYAVMAAIAMIVLFGMATGFDREAPMGTVAMSVVRLQFGIGGLTLLLCALTVGLGRRRPHALAVGLLSVATGLSFVAWTFVRIFGYSPH